MTVCSTSDHLEKNMGRKKHRVLLYKFSNSSRGILGFNDALYCSLVIMATKTTTNKHLHFHCCMRKLGSLSDGSVAPSLSTSGLADARGCSSFVVTCNNDNDATRRSGHTSPFTSRGESSQHSSTSTDSLSAKPPMSTRQLRRRIVGTKSITVEC